MKGTRPLENDEIRRVSTCFTGTFEVRNRGLFMLGVSTGGRISELLSLRIGDVFQNGKAVSDLLYSKSIVKGGEVSRAVPVNVDGRDAIEALIDWHREKYKTMVSPSRPLYPSRNKKGTVSMNRQTAHDMLKAAFMDAGLNGKLATHSLRKSFAQRVYEHSGDIYLVQELLGHANVSTTQKDIGVNYASAREAVEAIAVGKVGTDASDTSVPTSCAESYTSAVTLSSKKGAKMLSKEDRNSTLRHYKGMRYLHLSEFYSQIDGYQHISQYYFRKAIKYLESSIY